MKVTVSLPNELPEVTEIRQKALELQASMEQHAPEGRRLSLALTNLETSVMYAVKAVYNGDED